MKGPPLRTNNHQRIPNVAVNARAPKSQLLDFEIRLKETFDRYPQKPSVERTEACLGVFDEIIPLLGPFIPVLKILRDELVDSIYSGNFTCSDRLPFVERIPYFVSVNRMGEVRKGEEEETQSIVHDLEQRMKYRDRDLNVLYKKNLNLKEDIVGIEKRHDATLEKINVLQASLQTKEQEKEEIKRTESVRLASMRTQIETLQLNVEQANHMIDKLCVFKSSGTDVDKQPESTYRGMIRKKVKLDAQSITRSDLSDSRNIARQLNEILNGQLDDFEFGLAQLRRKREILRGMSTVTTSGIEMERDREYRAEITELTNAFQKRIFELQEEQELMSRHQYGLKRMIWHYKRQTQQASVKRSADEATRIFAITMHVSRDGNTFAIPKSVPVCIKCGGKTVLCPHRIGPTRLTLPENTTHVRFEHPSLHLNAAIRDLGTDDEDEEEEELEDEKEDNVGARYNAAVMDLEIEKRRKAKAAEKAKMREEKTDDQYVNEASAKCFARIWAQFKKRGGVTPVLPRVLNILKLNAFIQELSDGYWALDSECDLAENYESLQTFEDYAYDFLLDRYRISEVMFHALYDYFASMEQMADNSNIVMFTRLFSGDDDVSYKYFIVAKALFAKYDPLDLEAYRHMVRVMYPHRPKEFYEQMELEQVAFSKNRFSRDAVEDRLKYMLKRKVEPNYKLFNHNLKKYDYHGSGSLSCREFKEALGHLLPEVPAALKGARYVFAERRHPQDQVPIEQLALMSAYFAIYLAYKKGWAGIRFPTVGSGSGSAVGVERETLGLGEETGLSYQLSTDSLLEGGEEEGRGKIVSLVDAEGLLNTRAEEVNMTTMMKAQDRVEAELALLQAQVKEIS